MRSSSLSFALAALLSATPLLAQDAPPDAGTADAGPSELKPPRSYKLWVEMTPWHVQPADLELDLVTEVDPLTVDFYRGRTLPTPWGTDGATRWRFGLELPKEYGEVVLSYWSTTNNYSKAESRPGSFMFGTNLAYPGFAGIFDDGLADAYETIADLSTRDLRIEYRRTIAATPKINAKWSIGVRWVDANLVTSAAYDAVGAPIPAFYDPPDTVEPSSVLPLTDLASSTSRFSGRGLSTGIEVRLPCGKWLTLEGAFDVSLLRGDKSAQYGSITSAYFLNDVGNLIYLDEEALLDPGITGDVNDLQRILQAEFRVFADDPGSSASSAAFETYVGFRARVWRTFELLGGYRALRYEGILNEIRPGPISAVGAPTVTHLERRQRSLGYEGFYFGAAFTY